MPKILPLASPTAGNDNSLAKAAAICPSSLPDQGETLQAEVQAEAKTAASEEGPVAGSEGGFAEARTLQEAEPAKKRGSANKGRASRNKASAAAKSRKRKARKSSMMRASDVDSASRDAEYAKKDAQEKPVEPKEWTTPLPFATRSLPRLDCAKLPPVLGDFCAGLARELQVPG